MRTSIISQFLMLAIKAVILCSSTVTADSDSAKILLSKLEDALIENSTYLFQLQEMFFFKQSDSIKKKCHSVGVRIDVGEFTFDGDVSRYGPFQNCSTLPNLFCSGNWTTKLNYYYVCPDGPDEFQTSQILLGDNTYCLLQALDPLFYIIVTLSAAQFKIDCNLHSDNVTFTLYVDKLDLLPSNDDIQRAEIALLSLAKGYARTKRHLTEIQYGDISTVTTVGDSYRIDSYHIDGDIIIDEILVVGVTFYFANLLIIGLVTRYLGQSLQWLHDHTKNVYNITAIVVMVVNCASFIVRCTVYRHIEFFAVLSPLSIILSILVIEIAAVLYHTYKMRVEHKCKRFFFQFLACCHIIWFIHSLATDAIIATLNFIVSPAQTVGMVTIYLSVIFGSIITLKAILSICDQDTLQTLQCLKNSFKQCLSLTCVLFTGVLVVALMSCVTFVYVILVRRGLSTAGAGGFLLSFAPPLVALVVGAFINRERIEKFFTSEDHEGQNISAMATRRDNNVQELEEETFPRHTYNTLEAAQHSCNGNSTEPTEQQAGLVRRASLSSSMVKLLLKESA